MQQNLFSEPVEQDKKDVKIHLGTGLDIQIINGSKPRARLYRLNVLIKTVDLSDKTARRLFVVEVVELGAIKSKLAEVLGISRQTIHNYVETQKKFGPEGLINSYQSSNSKSRATQRKINKEKLPKGNKARMLEEIRRKEREEKEQNAKQLLLFSSDVAEEIQTITSDEQPFSEIHDWEANRYAGVFLYLICLLSKSRWFELVAGYFGRSYKIFMVFILMVGRNVPSIEQLKNIHSRESGVILGLTRLPSKPKLWEWFYNAADLKKSDSLVYDYFRHQMGIGMVGTWLWFIDGHLLPYTGKEKVHYSYNTQRRMPMPGRTNFTHIETLVSQKSPKNDLAEIKLFSLQLIAKFFIPRWHQFEY